MEALRSYPTRRRCTGRTRSCALLVCALLVAVGGASGCSEPARPRSAILIVLDTLRADRLSAYGHDRPTSPVLDGLARRGVLFESTVTNSTWTLPAMVALLSGSYPTKVQYDSGLKYSLVERLVEAGWTTAGFTGGGYAGHHYGLDLGFEHYRDQDLHELRPFRERAAEDSPTSAAGQTDGDSAQPRGIEKSFAEAEQWLEQNHREPFFMMVHTYEPHTPYDRQIYTEGMDHGILPETFGVMAAALVKNQHPGFDLGQTEVDYVRALYDGGVKISDQYIGHLLETLERLGIADETLIVVTADHGEDLGERDPPTPGIHGHALWDPLLLVPLIVFDPTTDYPVHRVSAQVRVIDTLPTILDLLGVEATAAKGGASLVPMMTGEESEDRLALSVLDKKLDPELRVKYAMRSGRYKLIVTKSTGRMRPREIALYDLDSDPGERIDIAAEATEQRDRMLAQIDDHLARLRKHGHPSYRRKSAGPMDPAEKRRLKELGYLE